MVKVNILHTVVYGIALSHIYLNKREYTMCFIIIYIYFLFNINIDKCSIKPLHMSPKSLQQKSHSQNAAF